MDGNYLQRSARLCLSLIHIWRHTEDVLAVGVGAIAVAEEQPQRAPRRRRKAVRDSHGRFLGWE